MDCRAFQAFQLRVGLLCLTFVLSILESSRRAVRSVGGTAGRNGVSQIGEAYSGIQHSYASKFPLQQH